MHVDIGIYIYLKLYIKVYINCVLKLQSGFCGAEVHKTVIPESKNHF